MPAKNVLFSLRHVLVWVPLCQRTVLERRRTARHGTALSVLGEHLYQYQKLLRRPSSGRERASQNNVTSLEQARQATDRRRPWTTNYHLDFLPRKVLL